MGEVELVQRLRLGDQSAFAEVVQRYHGRLVRFAGTFVARADIAEDVAQETWVAMLRGIDAFEGRATLQTWLFSICANRARTVSAAERRLVPMDPGRQAGSGGYSRPDGTSAADGSGWGGDEAGVSGGGWAEGAFGRDGSWSVPPQPWRAADGDAPGGGGQLVRSVRRAIMALPDVQRQVVTLRDVEGLSALEVCDVLGLSEGNQRVLLHRGRAFVRRFIDAEAPR